MSKRGFNLKTKYFVVCVFLALALPFSSFAVDNFSLDESQFSLIWNAQSWNYFSQTYTNSSGTGSTLHKPGTYKQYFMYDSAVIPSSYNGLSVYGRLLTFSHIQTSSIRINIPIQLLNIDNFSTDFFLGLWSLSDGTYVTSLNNYIDSISIFGSDSNGSVVVPDVIFNNKREYFFNTRSSLESSQYNIDFFKLYRLSCLFDTSSLQQIIVRVFFTTPLPIPDNFYFFCGMASDTEITSQDGQQQAVISGLSGIQTTIDGLVSDLQENDGKIIDSLTNLEYILEGDAVTAADAEQLVQDSLSKGEELGQLGDAFASVPKPDINSVTSVIKPDTVLQNNDSASVQLAMSPLYSWDKLLAILGVLVAVFSISYILFGKKK